ncbi:hypothetical protein [Candidatus Solirubrobacter pratensis]|uniref:hypothetical protein n=1 Tax=Candidatus Solirubrobacter pratensis TaxID=1298857 RepID=UPI0003FE5BBE|nr:hypothetical protein [Candidatus Solirubrobacter pratensis]
MELEMAARAATANGSSVLLVAYVAFVWCSAVGSAVALAVRGRRAELRRLRRCPRCAQRAVRAVETFSVDAIFVEVRIECGQCGIARRLVVARGDLCDLVRRLERDRRAIGGYAVVMTRARTRSDFEGFMRELRDDIVGADDFMALTGPRS